MTGTQILAIVAFLALALAVLLVLRGMGQIIAATRADEAFRRGITDVVSRARRALEAVAQLAAPARYATEPLDELGTSVAAAAAQLVDLRSEIVALQVPKDRRLDADAIARDLAAASESLGLLGLGLTADPTAPEVRRTSIKRGYLALAHATRSLIEHGFALESPRPQPARRRRG